MRVDERSAANAARHRAIALVQPRRIVAYAVQKSDADVPGHEKAVRSHVQNRQIVPDRVAPLTTQRFAGVITGVSFSRKNRCGSMKPPGTRTAT